MDKSKKEEMSIYSKKFFAKKKAASNTPEIKAIAIKQGINKIWSLTQNPHLTPLKSTHNQLNLKNNPEPLPLFEK